MAPSAPPQLPGFRFVEPIGQGGFADVYLYEQFLPSRRVAVKVLKRGADGARLDMFHAEANVMAQLSSHPSIMPIYQADVSAEGHPYLVMEFCPGPHLAQRFRRETIPVAEALEIAVKVSSAVETAHRAGILHRDIKPHNILTNAYGSPLLTDFGISTAVGAGGEGEHGMSIPWSAPEVLADAPHADVRSDVFSLAATLYSLLASRSPFEVPGATNDSATLINRIERTQPSRILRPDVPDSLNEVLLRAMSKRPDDRPQTARDFARELQEIEIELRRTPTRLEILDAGPTELAGPGNDDRTMIKPISVIVPAEFQPTALPREIQSETVMQRRFQPAPAGLVAQGPHLAVAASAPPVQHHSTTGPVAPEPRRERRNPWPALVVGVVLAAVAAFGVISMLGEEADTAPDDAPTFTPPGNDLHGAPAPAPSVKYVKHARGLQFTWTNAAPLEGDTYKVVATRDGESLPEQRIPATNYLFKLRRGQTGCVRVTVIRKNLTQQGEPSAMVCGQP